MHFHGEPEEILLLNGRASRTRGRCSYPHANRGGRSRLLDLAFILTVGASEFLQTADENFALRIAQWAPDGRVKLLDYALTAL